MIRIKAKKLNSWQEKSEGLLGNTKASPIFFKTRFGIHTFLMKFPIDIVVLDQNYKVVKIRQNLKPNRIFFWNPRFYNVLELPNGWLKKYKIKLNSTVRVE